MSDPASPLPKPPQFRMLWYWLTLIVIALFAISPMFLFVAGVVISGDHNCAINEGNTTPCIIDGADWSETLQFFGLAPLYLLLTFPLAIVFFVVWIIVLLVHQARWGRRLKNSG